jgi:adenine-specific DNA-methyltransferase
MARQKNNSEKTVESFRHKDASRRHIPTAEYQSIIPEDQLSPIQVAYQLRNPDLDPQLVWRGKDMMDWSDLVVQAPPLYIQEKIHPKVLIDDLRRQTLIQKSEGQPQQLDLFGDFNGLPNEEAKTEFYQHDANWSNRMILGDSLQVMASLAEREGLRGQVQMIYIDPPYGIKFNSNFQWSTTNTDVKDGNIEQITRQSEQVKAYRDTWRDGINSYLSYLRDRFLIAYDLLNKTGSIFVQISDENVHRVRALLDEIFGDSNFICQISYKTKKMALGTTFLGTVNDYILWYARDISNMKFHKLFIDRDFSSEKSQYNLISFEDGFVKRLSNSEKNDRDTKHTKGKLFRTLDLHSSGRTESCVFDFSFQGRICSPTRNKSWKTNTEGIEKLIKADRLVKFGKSPEYKLFFDDYPVQNLMNVWEDTQGASDKRYVVETSTKPVQRCLLMTTDPGDLVLDPTCGAGTTAYVAEQWGRRWITIDTSRVALVLARARLMSSRFPFYILKDSQSGQRKEAEITSTINSNSPCFNNIRHGFVNDRIPHITIRSIAHNSEIDVIWERFQGQMDTIRDKISSSLGLQWDEWEVPRNPNDNWPSQIREYHDQWWKLRIARQKAIDASIASKAEFEYLFDKPYEDSQKVRVAGPFTMESVSPHRTLGIDENDELIDQVADGKAGYAPGQSFEQMILENLKTAGIQQAHKTDKIDFFSLTPWPGSYICAEGRYFEGGKEIGRERRAGIFIGPEFGTVARPDLVAAAREAGDAGFDVLVACAFNYDAHSTDFSKLGSIPVLKARMNADLHMADDLKNTGKGNLFVIFGEPDIDILEAEEGQIKVKINGVDVFDPATGEVRSDSADGIACWFIDTDYNEESFFVRHAYFLGANDPYSALKTTLKAEINEEAWESLHSDTSRSFDKPASGRIAVKVINHLGDEVMKVFKVN